MEVKLDYNLKKATAAERNENVKQVIENTPPEKLTPTYLSYLADFILGENTIEERKATNKIITKNRAGVINDRETSFEGLVSKLENGEDGIYNMITNNNHIILDPKSPITQKDIDTIPALANVVKDIADQYEIKGIYNKPIRCMHLIKSFSRINLEDKITIDAEGNVRNDGYVSFFDPKHVSALLCNYSKLKEDSWEAVSSDAKWLIEDFENLVDATLKDKYPLYYDIVIYKIDGRQKPPPQKTNIIIGTIPSKKRVNGRNVAAVGKSN